MAKCVPCLSSKAKQVLTAAFPKYKAVIESIALCKGDIVLNICSGTSGSSKNSGRGKSAYNIFVSECMKAKNIKGFGEASGAMRECAHAWKEKKHAYL